MIKITTFIFIDTCVWVNLAKEIKFEEHLSRLREISDLKNFKIVVPESVKVEFASQRTSIEKENDPIKWANSKKTSIETNFKTIQYLIPHKSQDIDSLLKEFYIAIEKEAGKNLKSLKIIDEIFNKAETVHLSDSMLTEAARRALHLVPPNTKGKKSTSNCVEDRLLWIAILGYLDQGETWFCTEDKDFSGTNNNELDPDLQKEVESKNFKYFYGIDKMLKEALPEKPELPEYISEYSNLFNRLIIAIQSHNNLITFQVINEFLRLGQLNLKGLYLTTIQVKLM